ncbi:MAG: TonB-dependent receptor [Gammaproteobacteria bacterium]
MRLALLPPLLSATIAAAQETGLAGGSESDAGIAEIVVEERFLSLDKLNSVKTPTPIIDVPQSLSIIPSEQIERQAFRSLGDILRYTPGLSISQGEGHRDAIIIRGIQTTADFFIDGIRDDVQYFRPLYNVEQVEVLRGSNALLFGRGGGGGVINRVTKQARLDEQFGVLDAGVDTFGAFSFAGDANYALNDKVAFRLNAYYQDLDNHRDFFDGESYAFNPTFTVAFAPDTSGTFSYEYLDDDRVVDRGVPSQNVDGGPDVPLKGFKDTFFGSPDANFTTLEAHIFRARLDHEFNEHLRGNVTAQYADYDKAYQNLFASEEVTVTNGTFPSVELDGYRDPTERENLIVQANLVGEFDTGFLGHTVLIGGEYGDQDTENSRQDNVFAVNGDDQLVIPFSDPLAIPAFGFTNQVRDRKSDVEFFSFYLQDQIDVTEHFKLVLGFRYDDFDIDVLDRIEANDGDATDGNFSRSDDKVTPRLGGIFKPKEDVSIYVSYSETFLPQSGDQFLTLNLDTESTRPQTFENLEAGIKWDIKPDLSLTAAVFDLEREAFSSVDPEDQAQVLLVDGSETRGFELQLTGLLTEWWSITAGYSYLDGEVKVADGSGNDGNDTRQTPENMFSIWNQFQINDKLGIGLGLTYQDSFYVLEDNAVRVPDFTRVDAALFYDVSSALSLQVNIENLLDETYFPDAHSNDNISTGEPINARFSVRYRF